MLSQIFVFVFSKRFRLVGRFGNAQSIADRISGSRNTTRMWQELAEKRTPTNWFPHNCMLPEYYMHLLALMNASTPLI